MKVKKRLLNSPFGNKKGFVFALDIVFAIAVFIILLLAVRYYVAGFHKDSLPDIQTARTGSDILAVLDNKGTLNERSTNEIETKMGDLLPPNYEMRITINGENCNVEAGSAIPDDRFVASGKRFLVSKSATTPYYCTARYWIWLN